MPVMPFQLGDHTYDQIVREAVARIPVHTPEWTNFNASDPGMTLLELFASIADPIYYRLDLVPERVRLKFLRLTGLPLRAASAARGVVTFANERGLARVVTLPPRLPLAAGPTGFATENALDVLPLELRMYVRRRLSSTEQQQATASWELYQTHVDDNTELEFYEAVPFQPGASGAIVDLSGSETVDRTLWLALLARSTEADVASSQAVVDDVAGKTLTLGLMPALDAGDRVLRAGGGTGVPSSSAADRPIDCSLYTGMDESGSPQYQPLDPRSDGDPLQDLALVQLTLPPWQVEDVRTEPELLDAGVNDSPPALQDRDISERLLTWIRVTVRSQSETGDLPVGTKARFTWVGVNAAKVTQRIEVRGEPVGVGSGEPDQRFRLANAPVLPDTAQLVVGGDLWKPIDDLLAAPSEVSVRDPSLPPGATPADHPGDARVFSVDPASGDMRCGDGLRGARFPRGALLFANYAYGGGTAGNVGAGTLSASPALPPGFSVINPLPTWGGTEGETVTAAERNLPQVIRHRHQAVSQQDFEDIVCLTPGIDLGRVNALPLFHPDIGAPAPGVVTVLVVPKDPRRPEGPVPDQLFLRAVCEWLEPRRLLTTEVHVRGPLYLGVMVAVGIDVIPGRDLATVRNAVAEALRLFLSPTVGGVDHAGWPLEKAVETTELLVQAARVDGVLKVRGVSLWTEDSAGPVSSAAMVGLQLPRLDRITVGIGDPLDLRAAVPVSAPRKRRLPVPIIPRPC
jgi:baseplate J-like protein